MILPANSGAGPVPSANGTAELALIYETTAQSASRTQAALAAQRLANLPNKALPTAN